jgi:hypothetical protein
VSMKSNYISNTFKTIILFLTTVNIISCDEDELYENNTKDVSSCYYAGSDEEVKDLVNLLDSCTTERNDLKSTLKNNTKSKNGSRLKVLSYKGDDGSESSTIMFFDTFKNIICSPVKYECNDKVYCVAADSIQSTKEFDKYSLCSSVYNNSDSIIVGNFSYDGVKDLPNFVIYSNEINNTHYYTDPNCSYRYSYDGDFIIDNECHYSKSDIFRVPITYTKSNKNICINGSSFYEEVVVNSYEYYKPKASSFSTIYKYENEECLMVTENAILLSSLPDISLEQAKVNRNIYCSDYCSNLESELDDYVEMKLEPM